MSLRELQIVLNQDHIRDTRLQGRRRDQHALQQSTRHLRACLENDGLMRPDTSFVGTRPSRLNDTDPVSRNLSHNLVVSKPRLRRDYETGARRLTIIRYARVRT